MQVDFDNLLKIWPIIVAFVVFFAMTWKNQRLIIQKLSQIDINLIRHDEHINELFHHKEDCLKRRVDCEKNFLSKRDHNQAHT
jgi:hypothetical protein